MNVLLRETGEVDRVKREMADMGADLVYSAPGWMSDENIRKIEKLGPVDNPVPLSAQTYRDRLNEMFKN